jgi:hypothetical protein
MLIAENMTSTTKQVEPRAATSNSAATQLPDGQRGSRKAFRLEIAVESPKPDAHRLFMREYLAPLLAKEFLRQRRHVAIRAPTSEVNANVSTSEPSIRRDGW